jgi:hypothetical protein
MKSLLRNIVPSDKHVNGNEILHMQSLLVNRIKKVEVGVVFHVVEIEIYAIMIIPIESFRITIYLIYSSLLLYIYSSFIIHRIPFWWNLYRWNNKSGEIFCWDSSIHAAMMISYTKMWDLYGCLSKKIRKATVGVNKLRMLSTTPLLAKNFCNPYLLIIIPSESNHQSATWMSHLFKFEIFAITILNLIFS